jgi:NADPH-dependent glutamate synthase beta subunit-like oxidoreductase
MVTHLEIKPKPAEKRRPETPWPEWPQVLRTSSSHEEGCDRIWSASPRQFIGSGGRVCKVDLVHVEWSRENGRQVFREKPGSGFGLYAELVVLALGFIHVEHGRLVTDLQLATDSRGNLMVDRNRMTSHPGVFAAGDCVSGASLVVRAIAQGRKAAEGIEQYLAKLAEKAAVAG